MAQPRHTAVQGQIAAANFAPRACPALVYPAHHIMQPLKQLVVVRRQSRWRFMFECRRQDRIADTSPDRAEATEGLPRSCGPVQGPAGDRLPPLQYVFTPSRRGCWGGISRTLSLLRASESSRVAVAQHRASELYKPVMAFGQMPPPGLRERSQSGISYGRMGAAWSCSD
jgi:hypothetical protein